MNRTVLLALAALLAVAACDEDDGGFDTGLDDGSPDGDTDADADSDADVDGEGECGDLDDNFDPTWVELEEQVLELVNEQRSQGADCGSAGSYGSAPPLAMQSQLRAAARRHSWHMGDNGYFAHESPGGPCGDDLVGRVESAGYTGWSALGENIAAGYPSPEQAMAGWMSSDGHCSNIMESSFEEIGIGYAEVPGSEFGAYWTQDFGRSF
ncbi:MAG: CAP domain-containing protein [Polyangia bacterium]